MKAIPRGSRVIVKRCEEEYNGKILIPDAAKEKEMAAHVVAVGPGKLDEKGKRIEIDLMVGEKVLIGRYSGSEIKINGEPHIVLDESEILVRFETL